MEKVPPAPLRPPAALKPVTKRPVILIDVGAATKSPAAENTSAAKAKEHKPILIDKFASKKAVVDPLFAQSVLAPPKPGKASLPRRFKDEFRRKSGLSGGSHRRMAKNDVLDEEASELDLSICGAVTAKKGRNWSNASRKEGRLQAARNAKPVKAEIMEVAEDGMLVEELAYNLAIMKVKFFIFYT